MGPKPPATSQDANAVVQLAAVEGRPTGLVLRLQCDLREADHLDLFRVGLDGEPVLLQSFANETSFGHGVEIVDSTITPGPWTYQLAARVGEELGPTSTLVDVEWRQLPVRPAPPQAAAPRADVVELVWEPAAPAYSTAVFRRDVLSGGKFERVASVRPGQTRWVDRAVGGEGVWAYGIAFAVRAPGSVLQYGPMSEEAYVTTPGGQ